jgi:citrate lyase subunit beta / citryl-CoA lyase
MSKNFAVAGNSGPRVRSDCQITLELRSAGGIGIDLTSKVKVLYGESIMNLISTVLGFYGIADASVRVVDTGALPFVISARVESAVRQLTGAVGEYLPEMIKENRYPAVRDRFRISRLYLPGNTPGLMINAGLHSADGIILDLEDSVSPEKKDEARILVRNALRQVNFHGAERMVRINQGRRGVEDLGFVIPHNVNLIIIPKCESADDVRAVDAEIALLKERHSLNYDIFLMPVIESAAGIEHSFEIASSSANIVAMAIGLEDYTADLGVARTLEGNESFYARTRLVVAARAAGIQPIDSVFSDVGDMEALRQIVKVSKGLGFEGMGCIHPRQIAVIREGFAPDTDEIERSIRIVTAFRSAASEGLGVVALGTKMIDAPVVTRAMKTLDLAVRLGLLPPERRDNIPADYSNEP